MSELKRRRRFANSFFADEDVEETITTLEEQLSDELDTEDIPQDDQDVEIQVINEDEVDDDEVDDDDVDDDDDDVSVDALMAQADELLASCEANNDTTVSDDAEIISKECAELEAKIASIEKEEEKKASEVARGIEDEIGDEARGGDPSVSEIVKNDVECSSYKEVFPTNSKYVANITKRLDRVATILEKRGMKRLAFRVDQLSDKLESSIK